MKTYKVEMILKIDDGCLDEWIPNVIYENLEISNGEDLLAFRFVEVKEIETTLNQVDWVEIGDTE